MQVTELTTERLTAFVNRIATTPSVYRANKKGIRKNRLLGPESPRIQKSNANGVFTPLRAALKKVHYPRIRYFTPAEIFRLIGAAPDWFRPLIQAAQGPSMAKCHSHLCLNCAKSSPSWVLASRNQSFSWWQRRFTDSATLVAD